MACLQGVRTLPSLLSNIAKAGIGRTFTSATKGAVGSLQFLRSFATVRPARSLGSSLSTSLQPQSLKPLVVSRGFTLPRTLQLLQPGAAVQGAIQQTRNVTKFNYRNGQQRTSKAVIKRFMRLNCGLWIRPRSGRAKKLWKKPDHILQGLRTHVICNRTQSKMLDKMVGDYWKRPKYYVDDPYEPYHVRNNFPHVKKTWW
uniref:Large ribosomal subunit protein bL35m n=1 Tax=Rhipicephalus zambeziensis TaxID=60191 RepID=A0A224YXR4_9ACAR